MIGVMMMPDKFIAKWDGVPFNVRRYILDGKANMRRGCNYYVRTNDIINGKCVLRTFAYKNTQTYGLEVQECFREYLDHNECKHLYYQHICGYTVDFERKDRKWYMDPDDDWGNTIDKYWRPGFCCDDLIDYTEVKRLLSKDIPYFYLDPTTNDVMGYARAYIENPKFELLAKAGFGYLYNCKGLFKVSGKKQKQYINWLMANKKDVFKYSPGFAFIRDASRTNRTYPEHAKYLEYKLLLKGVTEYLPDYSPELADEIVKYLQKQKSDAWMYRDYIEAARGIGKDVQARGVLFPRNFKEAHDLVTQAYSDLQNKENNQILTGIKDYLQPMVVKYKDLTMVIPATQHDLSSLGNALSNCVGSFARRIIDKECYVVAVYLNGEPIECCELGFGEKGLSIVQLRGKNNHDSERHEDCLKLMHKFINNYKRMEVQA